MQDEKIGRPRPKIVWGLLNDWLPVLLCSIMILGLGADSFSRDSTSRFLEPLILWILPGLDAERLAQGVYAIRKLAHAAEYGLLALLVIRATAIAHNAPLARGARAAMAVPIVVALLDESRQATSNIRSGSPWDVLLDATGALLLIMALHLLQRWLGRPLFRPRARRPR